MNTDVKMLAHFYAGYGVPISVPNIFHRRGRGVPQRKTNTWLCDSAFLCGLCGKRNQASEKMLGSEVAIVKSMQDVKFLSTLYNCLFTVALLSERRGLWIYVLGI